MNPIGLSWTQIKAFFTQRNNPLMYYTSNNHYFIFLSDGPLTFQVIIRIDSPSVGDQKDFEDNFKDDIDTNETPIGTKIIGFDGALGMDIQLIDGVPSLRTFGIQAIESLRGFDPQCDVWFYIGTELDSGGVGAENDTITLDIAAGGDPTNFPAINVVYTLTAGDEAGDEDDLALNVAAFFNTQSPFNVLWRAQRVSGNGVIYISAKKPGGQFERPNLDDFDVSSTGTTTVTRAFDKIIRRNKITGLARDPADPRNGQLGVQGSVVQSEGDVTSRFQTVFSNLLVDGSSTPVDFEKQADATDVEFISSVIISASGNGIKYGQFLSKAGGGLTNGLQISFKSKDVSIVRAFLKTTDDLDDLHAEDPDNSRLDVQAGGDKYIAVLSFGVPLELRPQGEFVTDDFLKITVNDDLTSGISELRAIVNGFSREF